jgi:two-component sensor histidine kinase
MYLEDLVATVSGLAMNKNFVVKTRIDEFNLAPKLLFPLGAIVNELITNAFKYAFAENESGIIQVRLAKRKDTVSLTVKDNGRGLPKGIAEEKTESLGLMLVRMRSQQLQGSFSIEDKNGVECKIRFGI